MTCETSNKSGSEPLKSKTVFVWPTQQKSQETTGCQISGGFAGYECLEACPQLTVEITLQWQPCLSNVEKAGKKAYVLLVKLQMSWSAPRLISQIEVTKKKQRRTTEQPLWVKLWSISLGSTCFSLRTKLGKLGRGRPAHISITACLHAGKKNELFHVDALAGLKLAWTSKVAGQTTTNTVVYNSLLCVVETGRNLAWQSVFGMMQSPPQCWFMFAFTDL